MRKSLLLLVTIAPLAALIGHTAPASAESSKGACVTDSVAQPVVPLDLDTIPAKPVTGPLAIQGAGDDDECDDMPGVADDDDDGRRAGLRVDGHEPSDEDLDDDD